MPSNQVTSLTGQDILNPLLSTSAVLSTVSSSQTPVMSLNPDAPTFIQQTRQQKATSSAPKQAKTVQEAEISLLKQELVIARTKILQLEAENKDMDRKTRVLGDTVKMYESDANQELRRRYFRDKTSSAKSPSPSTGGTSSPFPPCESSTSVATQTIDRLINYFLNVVEKIPNMSVLPKESSSPTSNLDNQSCLGRHGLPSTLPSSSVPEIMSSSSTKPSPSSTFRRESLSNLPTMKNSKMFLI